MKNILLFVFSLFQLLSCELISPKPPMVLNRADSTAFVQNTLIFWRTYPFATKQFFCVDIILKSDGTCDSIELISNHVPDSVKAIGSKYISDVIRKNLFRFSCESSRYPLFCPLVVEVDQGIVNDILLWTGDNKGNTLIHYSGVQKRD